MLSKVINTIELFEDEVIKFHGLSFTPACWGFVVSPRLAKLGVKLESIVVSPRIELGSSV